MTARRALVAAARAPAYIPGSSALAAAYTPLQDPRPSSIPPVLPGSSPCNGCGLGGVAGESIIVMVTNLCPYNGNQQWCPQVGGTNQYGYSYHFDIMAQSEIFGDNVVVNFEPVACPGQATSDWETWFQQLIFDVSHADNDENNVDLDLEFSWCDADGVRTMRRKWLDWRDDLCGGFHL
ncbi:hypothetical protein ZTR_04640 [Talaromyces verruculosus]|nr:hypothetical protein ZTR_04640 [Talaromyces verruculosus]